MKFRMRWKILIITAITFLLAIGANTLVISQIFRKGYSAALQSKMDVIANTLRTQLERLSNLGIAIEDIEGFEVQCQEVIQKHKDVAYAMVAQANGRILFHNDPTRHNTIDAGITKAIKNQQSRESACLSEIDGKKYYNTVVPVENNLGESGIVVAVGYPTELIDSKISELHYYSSIVAIVSLSLATFSLLTILSLSVTKPLSNLVNTIHYIRDSFDLSKRVEITSKDELGDLAHSFNHMIEDLQSTTTSIDNLNQEVEQRKEAEQCQVQLLKQLGRKNQELEDFAHIVSHDLKAPLRGIKLLIDLISEDYADKLDDDGKKKLDLLLTRADRMHNLIDSVLQYSRVGRVEEEKTIVNLNELITEIIDTLAPPKNISITVENELPTIECGQTRTMQVFQNLLSNAIKYMDKPQGQIKVGCVEEDGFWKFSIADNGPGIEEKYFEKIFQIFQTISTRDEFESTGIGLTLVKKIIVMCGGKLWVESKVGEGSTFFFTLPIQKITAETKELLASNIR